MTDREFQGLPETIPSTGKVGDLFLTENLAKQKTQKKVGDTISYYKIISVNERGNIEYTMEFSVLE